MTIKFCSWRPFVLPPSSDGQPRSVGFIPVQWYGRLGGWRLEAPCVPYRKGMCLGPCILPDGRQHVRGMPQGQTT